MHFDLTILGCNGAIPAYSRHPTAQFLNYNGHGFLVDCGEGTQLQMARYNIRRARLDHVFISHLHGDHFYGLLGLITSFNLNSRETPLHIHGHPGIEEIVQTYFKHAGTQLKFALHFHTVPADAPQVIYEDSALTVSSIPLHHRIPTTGFLFQEKQGLRKILPEKIVQYQIPIGEIMRIKAGGDFVLPGGQVIPHTELTREAPHPRSYAFCSDTAYTESFLDQIAGVNLLYHEATFIEEHAERACETMHSTAKQAATIAKKAMVDKLLIGHFSARYPTLDVLLQEARSVFENTELAEEGKVIAVERD